MATRRTRAALATGTALSLLAAATTWVAMLSWRTLTHDASGFLLPLFGIGLVVALTGAAGRWWRVPLPALLAAQLLLAAMAVCWVTIGVPLPLGGGGTELVETFRAAVDTSNRFRPPVPAGVPAVHPLLVAGGATCLVLVDLLACSLRRIPLAGLPLLTVFSVPLSLVGGGGMSWWVFALTAGGFLGMLFLHESDQVAQWGRLLEGTNTDATGFGVRTGAIRTSAGAIGAAATALAIVAPLAIPTLDLDAFSFGPGSGGEGEIELENPITDMRRNLDRGQDVPLVEFTTDDPDPSYLRIAALARFSDNEWSSGDRDVPTEQVADGAMPPLDGVAASVARTTHEYDVEITPLFESKWLPTQAPISAITAEGDWRYDTSTMDFISGDRGGDSGGMTYEMTSVDLDLDPAALISAPSVGTGVSQRFLELPPTLPGMVRELAASVTTAAPSRFEKAVVLQDWFRQKGGFTYNTDVVLGSGTDDLVEFLSPGPDGREGYCEQFASAMAVMARALGIPARVAVGFLRPERVGPQEFEYSAWDLHAWPELYFEGAGWVAFEPTPPGRASNVPAYTRIDISDFPEPVTPTASANPSDDARPAPREEDLQAQAEEDPGASSADSGIPWLALAGGTAGVLAVGWLLVLPRTVRRRRRERRLDGDPEDVWAELHDSVVDLGLPWPAGRSPRETGAALAEHVDDSSGNLAALVRAVELSRYARPGTTPAVPLRAPAEACVTAMYDWAPSRAQRLATWLPRSVFRRRPQADRPHVTEVETTPSGVVEHVG